MINEKNIYFPQKRDPEKISSFLSRLSQCSETTSPEFLPLKKKIQEIQKDYNIKGFSESLYIYDHNLSKEDILCPYCQKKKRKYFNYNLGYSITCSTTCGNKYSLNKENRKKGTLNKYGSENYFSSKDFQEKRKDFISKNPTFYETVKEKREQTMLEKYGTINGMDVPGAREKQKLSQYITFYEEYLKMWEKYKVKPLFSYNEYLTYFDNRVGRFQCLKCGHEFEDYLQTNTNRRYKCPLCAPPRISISEGEIVDYLKSLGLKDEEIIRNSRKIISPYELDIYIPKLKLAIEYNGLMYHSIGSSTHRMFDNLNNRNLISYHLNKTEKCLEEGIQLLHIYENEWMNNDGQEIWKSIISTKCKKIKKKYSARKLKVKELQYSEVKTFLSKNHLQGSIKSSINLGLVDSNDHIIMVMTFGKSRYLKSHTYELYRLCTELNSLVVGGGSKLLAYFKKNFLQKDEVLVTYADRRFSIGNIYQQLGFSFLRKTSPNYKYFLTSDSPYFCLFSREKFMKHKLSKILEKYDPSLTESENMYKNGYRKIYDCGNLVFEYKKE